MILWLLVIAFAVMVAGGALVVVLHPWWCDAEHEPPVWVDELVRQRCRGR